MKALVLGYGSIGARHARILTELGCATTVVSARQVDFADTMHDLAKAVRERAPDYVVIANATGSHAAALRDLASTNFGGRVLIEKPLFGHAEQFPALPFAMAGVAYNLRFHPMIERLRALLAGESILSVQCYVGQYLPDWRPGTDYRQCYSVHADRGGGVLRDLSHEFDYLGHLLGPWRRVSAVGGHFSTLAGDSDDLFGLMLAYDRCPLTQVQMNYLDRLGRRQIVINTDRMTIEADFVAARLRVNRETEDFVVERDETYRAMHRSVLAGDETMLCSYREGLDTVALIEAAEQSASSGKWIDR